MVKSVDYKVLRDYFLRSPLVCLVRRFVSPVFVVMLIAASVLWYITKLSHVYTTDLTLELQVERQSIEVECVVEGVGSNLFGYHLYKGSSVNIPLTELKYRRIGADRLVLDEGSLMSALSVRFSDIKIISIDADATLTIDERIERVMERK